MYVGWQFTDCNQGTKSERDEFWPCSFGYIIADFQSTHSVQKTSLGSV